VTTAVVLWTALPSRAQIKARIDAFLRAFCQGELGQAFRLCPPLVYTEGQGMSLRSDLSGAELAEHLSHAMYQFIEMQSAAADALANAVATEPATWCQVVTPPGDADYADLSLEFPGVYDEDDDIELDEVPDDARATEEGEVLANVHILGEVTDITGRYSLERHGDGWILAFSNFDIM
jgi:hypothetical protein